MRGTRVTRLLLLLTCSGLACSCPLFSKEDGLNGPTVSPSQASSITPTASAPAEGTTTPADARTRVRFEPGATSARLQGVIEQHGTDEYVLWAAEGQSMSVRLLDLPADVLHEREVIIVIWGEDGIPLITDHAGASEWQGEIPVSQDYYVDVRSIAEGETGYELEIAIPPLSGDLPHV
jgi:hypothetical protein